MKTIFVIDDNNVNLAMAEDTLSDIYNVLTFASAATMFSVLNKVNPDLILLDILMPEIDGFETLRRLKADARYEQIPVIFLTGDTTDDVRKRGFEMGVVDYILKPFSAEVLLDRIKCHIEETDK